MPSPEPLLEPDFVIAFIASGIFLYLTLLLRLFDETSWVNKLRRWLYPKLHEIGNPHGYYAMVKVSEEERVGFVSAELSEVEEQLERIGFSRNIAASLKMHPNGSYEDASWAYRKTSSGYVPNCLSRRQIHTMLFEVEDGVDIYAHEEYSSIRPVLALAHYRGIGMSKELGVSKFRELWNERPIQ